MIFENYFEFYSIFIYSIIVCHSARDLSHDDGQSVAQEKFLLVFITSSELAVVTWGVMQRDVPSRTASSTKWKGVHVSFFGAADYTS